LASVVGKRRCSPTFSPGVRKMAPARRFGEVEAPLREALPSRKLLASGNFRTPGENMRRIAVGRVTGSGNDLRGGAEWLL
jgi:hypothetical protein